MRVAIALSVTVWLCVIVLIFAGCQTTPKGPTQTTLVGEYALADATVALAAAKDRMPPVNYEKAKQVEASARTVLFDAEQHVFNGNVTAASTSLCAFQSLLNEMIGYYGGVKNTDKALCAKAKP